MPLPVDVHPGTEPKLRGRISRWLRRPQRPAATPSASLAPAPARGVDTHTRSFWSGASPAQTRVAAMVRAHEQGTEPRTAARPRGNPAFSEALFVELMRARQYRRAYEQLSDDCKQRWGSADAFAAAQGTGALRRLQGVTVKDVRFLPEWTDPDAARTYEQVAELQVEYTLADAAGARVIPRVVHLVPADGRWRSLCYPM